MRNATNRRGSTPFPGRPFLGGDLNQIRHHLQPQRMHTRRRHSSASRPCCIVRASGRHILSLILRMTLSIDWNRGVRAHNKHRGWGSLCPSNEIRCSYLPASSHQGTRPGLGADLGRLQRGIEAGPGCGPPLRRNYAGGRPDSWNPECK